jgi:MFS family permease
MRKIFGLNFLDAFVGGAILVAVPLLIVERGISLGLAGIIFSLAAVGSAFLPLVFAMHSESSGIRRFYFANGIANALQALSYLLAHSWPFIAMGKVSEGVGQAAIWAVNRASVLDDPLSTHHTLGGLISGRVIYYALGSLMAGLLISGLGFDFLFAFLLLVSLGAVVASTRLWSGGREKKHALLPKFEEIIGGFRNRRMSFYQTVFVLCAGSVMYVAVMYLALPIYMKTSGFGAAQIATYFGAYFLIMGLVLHMASRHKVPARVLVPAGGFFFVSSLLGMAFLPAQYLPWLFFGMAIGDGMYALLWEELIYGEVKDSRRKALDIALLRLPLSMLTIVVLAVAGFAIEGFGFSAIFLAAALSFAIYGMGAGIVIAGRKLHVTRK